MDNRQSVAQYVNHQIEASGKTSEQIAREIGYDGQKLISFIRQGLIKLPVGKVGVFAKAVGADPSVVLRLVLQEYSPATWATITEVWGEAFVSGNELAILERLREISHGIDPKMQSDAHQEALTAFVASMAS